VPVSLPENLIKETDKVLERSKFGYENRPEFIKEAVRRRLEELKAPRPRVSLRASSVDRGNSGMASEPPVVT
jgi:metal-responsive CopG/Arc/MetJ family transcriptional regulator